MFLLEDNSSMKPLLPYTDLSRRQDLPQAYSLNGAIYIAHIDWLLQNKKFVTQETVAYTMPFERSLDLDTELDLLQLQILMGDK
jgi:N-acylneuraminate cytidylyltransferase